MPFPIFTQLAGKCAGLLLKNECFIYDFDFKTIQLSLCLYNGGVLREKRIELKIR